MPVPENMPSSASQTEPSDSSTENLEKCSDEKDKNVHENNDSTSPTNKDEAGQQITPDPDLVDWDGADDSANPRNWPKRVKMLNILLVSLSVLYTNAATTMFAPGASQLDAEFRIKSNMVKTLAITMPALGASLGPLLFAPCSELAGRLPVYWTCGGGTIADLLAKEERGAATAIFTAGPLLGPVLGPLLGGVVSQALGWRWTFYLVLIFAGVVTVVAMFTMRETNASIILEKKASRLRRETGRPNLRPAGPPRPPPRQLAQRALIRPIRMLLLSPIVLLIGMYVALVYGLTFLLFATFPSVFQGQYGWSISISGLPYLGLGAGCLIGVLLFSKLSDKMLRKDAGPERRLLLMIWVGPCIPISLFWYGWTTYYAVQWIVPIIGTSLIGVGIVLVTSSGQLYMMDVFGPQGAASALAAMTLIRNGSGAFLALAADPLYKHLGLGWGNSVLGFISVAFIPVPIVFYLYGPKLREKFPMIL